MTSGYVIFADDNVISQREACACAYSIKNFNKEAQVSVIVTNIDNFSEKYEQPFDNIIQVPFGKDHTDVSKLEWQAYWATPYENTIIIHRKTIVNQSHDEMWEYLIDHHSVCYPYYTTDYRNMIHTTDDQYKFLDKNSIRKIDTNLIFFKKDDTALAYFKLLDVYSQNYQGVLDSTIDRIDQTPNFDRVVLHSIAVDHFSYIEDMLPIDKTILSYIDMKNSYRLFLKTYGKWIDYLNVWTGPNGRIKIQNFNIVGTLSYELSEFLTDEIFEEQQHVYSTTKN